MLAAPFLPLAVDLQWSQLTLSDEVAERWFYGGLSMYLLAVVSLMALTSLDGRTRRFTGSAAVFLGLVSVVYPAELHSLGVAGGGALLVWCVAVAFVVSRGGRRRRGSRE